MAVNTAPDETETGLVEYEKAGGSGGGPSMEHVAVPFKVEYVHVLPE
jgi:hypothetical protein